MTKIAYEIDSEYDRCPRCKRNYITGEVNGRWITWYMFIAEFPISSKLIKIQVLYCPNCGLELTSAIADLEPV